MNVLLDALNRSEPGPGAALPQPWDERVARAVEQYTRLGGDDRARVRASLSEPHGWRLLDFAVRSAVLAVRLDSGRLVTLGLVALSLADVGDYREVLLRLPLLRRAAKLVGEDADAKLREAAELADERGRSVLLDLVGTAQTPAEMGYVEHGAGPTFDFRWDPPDPESNPLIQEMRAWRERLD